MIGLTEILTSAFGGGLTGLIGAGIQKFADYKTKKLEITAAREKNEHEIALRKVDAEIMAQEWSARSKIAEVEAAGKIEEADSRAFLESMKPGPVYFDSIVTPTVKQGWALITLDFIRAIVRPGLTIFLCGLTTYICLQARQLLNNSYPVTAEQAIQMYARIVDTILYLSTTCLLWWFGVRNKK